MKFLCLLAFILLAGCVATRATKNADLISPCAGCDDRILPKGNLKYLV
jgi:hypothetical protein